MTVKVEMQKNAELGIVALAFECSTVEEQEVVDAIRVAMMGDFEKRCGYVHSNRLVVHVKTEDLGKD